MSLAIGVIVANLYYLQPLLHQVTKDFRISESKATLLLVLIQAGYAAGLAFVVPLGDLIPRRRLAVLIFLLASVVVFAGAAVHSFVLFATITFFIGLASCGGQVILPLGADMANPAQRGRVIGRLMTGLLMGLLLSRSVSGIIAQAAGWRTVYVAAGVALALMAVVLFRVLRMSHRARTFPIESSSREHSACSSRCRCFADDRSTEFSSSRRSRRSGRHSPSTFRPPRSTTTIW